jgi:hypothetical protein
MGIPGHHKGEKDVKQLISGKKRKSPATKAAKQHNHEIERTKRTTRQSAQGCLGLFTSFLLNIQSLA